MPERLSIGVDRISCAMVSLRGDPAAPDFREALESRGISTPERLSLAGVPGNCALWFSPDELLALRPEGEGRETAAALAEAFGEAHAMALDVSDARTILRLTGSKVGDVLAKGTPCDCSDAGFPPGAVRRTRLAGLAVAIWRFDHETWEIACSRSFAHHLEAWLETAAAPAAAVDR